MNAIETKLQEFAIGMLGELKSKQAQVQTFLISGALPTEMHNIIVDIEKILYYLKPIINEIDALIPPTMPELKLVLDWAVRIINAVPS
jgi:hypothetical protein